MRVKYEPIFFRFLDHDFKAGGDNVSAAMVHERDKSGRLVGECTTTCEAEGFTSPEHLLVFVGNTI